MAIRDQELFSKITDGLAEAIAHFAYKIWDLSEFRELVNFEQISQQEQDRIFNELEVTAVGLVILSGEHHGLNKEFEQLIVKSFLGLYQKIGTEKEYIDIWAELIRMRTAEYRQDYNLALEQLEKAKEFQDKKTPVFYHWLRIEVLTLDGLSHIRRGKIKKGDKLKKLLLESFTIFDNSLENLFSSPEMKALFKDRVH